MSKNKKVKKEKKEKVSLLEKLRNQADEKNRCDCDSILAELDQASVDGEYVRTTIFKYSKSSYFF